MLCGIVSQYLVSYLKKFQILYLKTYRHQFLTADKRFAHNRLQSFGGFYLEDGKDEFSCMLSGSTQRGHKVRDGGREIVRLYVLEGCGVFQAPETEEEMGQG